MTRLWWIIAAGVVGCLHPVAALADLAEVGSAVVVGDMVDADVPATYRLPPVQAPIQIAARPAPAVPEPLAPPADWLAPVAVNPQSAPALAAAGSGQEAESKGEFRANGDVDVGPVDKSGEAEVKPQAAVRDGFERQAAHKSAIGRRQVDLTEQLLPAVQRGFGLAQRGALYAARTEFIQVLRRIALAHDAAQDTSEHSRALAAGLRALDEAEDFVPRGTQLEAELDVRKTASSHRTDLLLAAPADVSPLEAVQLYHEFAREHLAQSVAGEQAGSMALHGLGTIYSRLAARNDDDVELSRAAKTMYGAALAACPNNHLAANELGVLVCRGGRDDEAAALFMQAIDFAPSAVAYHNLAIALQRSGRPGEAAANEMESQRLAAMERQRGEVSRRAGVHWVTPEEMARASQPIQRTAAPANHLNAPAVAPIAPAPPPVKSPWQRLVDSTKSLPLPGGKTNESLGPATSDRMARPIETGNQTKWR
jgi:tetratricopeptide (TPR) repeat protein